MEEKRVFVKDLTPGQPVRDMFVISEARQGQARNGPFWSLTLQDSSGMVEAKIFSPQSQAYPEIAAGRLAVVEGQVGSYRDQVQVVVERLQVIEAELSGEAIPGVELAMFIPCSKEKPENLLCRLEELHRVHLHYPPWRKLCKAVLGKPDIRRRILAAPGAKGIHHAYMGGLVEHTLSVAEICLGFCDHYPSLDREILLVAATFHDLGKAWELTGGLTREYTDEGRLLGHIVIGLQVLEPFLKKLQLDPGLEAHLRHIILSHHGQYEYGSPKRPKTTEALALHFADNLDAKIQTVDGLFEDGAEGQWSPYQHSLERFMFRPVRTPRDPALNRERPVKSEPTENQCLLPLKG